MRGNSYVPDFRKAFEFFCIHAGGRAVLDAIEKNLQLTKRDMTPSRATLSRYGNTSSSSVWYVVAHVCDVWRKCHRCALLLLAPQV